MAPADAVSPARLDALRGPLPARGVVDVAYRFYREVFDEPDIPALDLRVRGFVQQMIDGGATAQR